MGKGSDGMSKVTVSEEGISISESQSGESFDVEVKDSAGNHSELFLYLVPESGGDDVIAWFTGESDILFGQTDGDNYGTITKIIVIVPEGEPIEDHLPGDGGEFRTRAGRVEIYMEPVAENMPLENTQPGTGPETETPFSVNNAELTMKGTFERQTSASEISEGMNEGTPAPAPAVSCQYDKESRILRLSGDFLFRENAYGAPFNVSEVLVRSVDESAWTEIWNEWAAGGETPDPGKALTITGTEIDSFSGGDGGRIVIISSAENVQFSLDSAGAETPAVIFSKAAASKDVSVVREADALTLHFSSPHLLTTADTVWRFDTGEQLIITGFDEQSWGAAIQDGGITGEFSIHGGTAQINHDGTRQISGTPEAQVQLDFPAAAETVLVQHDGYTTETPEFPLLPVVLGGALVVACAVIAVLAARFRKAQKGPGNARGRESRDTDLPVRQDEPRPVALRVGRLQNIGKRPGQQDSMGVISVQGGVFAVVADGMGGLSDGDKVSQKIVQTMLGDVNNRRADQIAENMAQLVAHANSEVNQMLGYSNQYKSGSTLLAVMAEPGRFHWVAVGDSRIYLYRGGSVIQINHEHVLEMELVTKAVNRELSFQEARGNKKKGSVTSFIGMGELRYIDMSLGPVLFVPGDKILLMSDGVFNTISEMELGKLLEANPDPAQAAKAIEAGVLARDRPHQDNFSCIIIDYS